MELRFAGVELYFDDLPRARKFYHEVLGLTISDESAGHHAKFEGSGTGGFVCVERKGSENYPSKDKAVLFFEVDNLAKAIEKIGDQRFVHQELTRTGSRQPWAVLHDPEGHNILLLER